MAKATRRRNNRIEVNYYNSTNLPPQGADIQRRKDKCNSDAEKILYLYELQNSMTPWEAYRQFISTWGEIEKNVCSARIKGLCDKGYLYKSTEQVMEQEGALNNVVKLFPQEGFPEDFDMTSLDKIHVPLSFGSDGLPDAEKTRQEFEIKLQEKLNEYNNGE
jgi:hypothetical protein